MKTHLKETQFKRLCEKYENGEISVKELESQLKNFNIALRQVKRYFLLTYIKATNLTINKPLEYYNNQILSPKIDTDKIPDLQTNPATKKIKKGK